MSVRERDAEGDGWGGAAPPPASDAFARPWRHLGPPLLRYGSGAPAPLLLPRRKVPAEELLWIDRKLRRAVFGPDAAAVAVMVGALLVAMLVMLRLPVLPEPAPPAAIEAQAPAPAVDEEARLAASVEAFARRLSPGTGERPILEIPEGLRRIEVFAGPFVAIDGVTLRTVQGEAIRLAEIDGFSRDQVCMGLDGLRFACGLHARAALTNLVRDRRLSCAVTRELGPETIEAVCRFDAGLSLSERLVVSGWAVPRADKREAYAALVEARCDAGNDRASEVRLCRAAAP